MVNVEQDVSSWLTRPLCRRYRLAVLDAARVRWRGMSPEPEGIVHWGIGWLPDGELDVLGAWMCWFSSELTQTRIVVDLQRRGVESVRHTVGRRGDAVSLADLVSSTPWPTLEPADVDAQRAAGEVRRQVARHLTRDGAFESESAVLHRVAMALQRFGRQPDRAGHAVVGQGGAAPAGGRALRRLQRRHAH